MTTHNVEYLRRRLLKARRQMAQAQAAYQYYNERATKLAQQIEEETIKQGLIPDVTFGPAPEGPPGGQGESKVVFK
jgi:hypothetical protein